MKSFRVIFLGYVLLSLLFVVFSYGFVDRNLHLGTFYLPMQFFVFEKRGWAGGVYLLFLAGYWLLYYFLLKSNITILQLKKLVISVSAILLFSFPAFSYDIFNYMLTAKVAFTHKENPWMVRPIEIPNESALAYTRAANKRALYGPSWILLTLLPHVAGLGNVWMTIILFKLLVFAFYYFFLFMVWRVTKQLWNVTFFAFNPLVLITILNEGHNDIVMMVFACAGILFQPKIGRGIFFLSSILIKGATIVLAPLFLLRLKNASRIWTIAYWLMFGIFLLTPLREEMYPWYFVWCMCCVVFLPKSHRFLYGLTLAFSFGLLLRNTPYIVTRQYDGYNQLIRTAGTWIPVVVFLVYSSIKRFKL